MKKKLLFSIFCMSFGFAASLTEADDQVTPKVVKVGQQNEQQLQALDAQPEQHNLKAKVGKQELFDYLDKNYGATQQRAESAPVEAEELSNTANPETTNVAPKIVKLERPQAIKSEPEVSEEAMEEELPPAKEEKKPWQIKVAEPAEQKRIQQPTPMPVAAPKQLAPIKLVEKKNQQVTGNFQAKRFVLKGFEPASDAADSAGKKIEIKLDALNEKQKREIDALVQAEAKQQPVMQPAAQPVMQQAQQIQQQVERQINQQQAEPQPIPQQVAKPAEPASSIFGRLAPAEGKKMDSEQKRYPVMNRELLEAKQKTPVAPVAPAQPLAPVPPAAPAVQAEAQVMVPAQQDKVTFVEVPSVEASEDQAQRIRAPEKGNEKATTRDLNLRMLEAPSAPAQVTFVNKQPAKPAAKAIAQKKEIQQEEIQEEKEEPKKQVSREAASADEKVVRSTFTSRVNGLEPADSISSAKPNARKLYYFSEIGGMSGRNVTHRWEQGGKVLAEKQMSVGSNKWRLWSSATPKSGATGDVTVSVVDDSGAVLKTESLAISN